MQLKHLAFITAPLAALAAPAESQAWTAFFYTGESCGQSGSLIATVPGYSNKTYFLDDYTSETAKSVSVQWNVPQPSTYAGVFAVYTNTTDYDGLYTVGAESGNACIKPFLERYDIDAWKSCDKPNCAGVPQPDDVDV